MKVNGKEIKWEDPPKGEYLTDVKIHVLWEDKKTGANLTLLKAPKAAGPVMEPHAHHNANEWSFYLAGELEAADGTKVTVSPDNTMFGFVSKGETHGKGGVWKALGEVTWLRYHDGPSTRAIK